MKKIIFLTLGFFACLFLSLNGALAASGVVKVEGGGEVKQNNKFPINIFVNPNGNKICALTFTLSYPADLITLDGAPTFGSDAIMSTEKNTTTAGTIYYQLGITGCTTENLKLITANFMAQKTGSGNFNFSLVKAYGGVDGSDMIKITSENGAFSISAPDQSENNPVTSAPTSNTEATTKTEVSNPSVNNPATPASNSQSQPEPQPKPNVSDDKVDNQSNNVFIWMISFIILLEIVLLFIYALRRKKSQNLNFKI